MFSNRLWSGSVSEAFADLQELLDRVGFTVEPGSLGEEPAINLDLSDDSVVLSAALPGVTPEDVEITVDGDTITLAGLRRAPLEDGLRPLRRERREQRFQRSLKLPCPVDADSAQARCANGILVIALRRPQAAQPRRVSVSAA